MKVMKPSMVSNACYFIHITYTCTKCCMLASCSHNDVPLCLAAQFMNDEFGWGGSVTAKGFSFSTQKNNNFASAYSPNKTQKSM